MCIVFLVNATHGGYITVYGNYAVTNRQEVALDNAGTGKGDR
jgi:hypothetical protein